MGVCHSGLLDWRPGRMLKVPSRANRRHHRARMVAKAIRVFRTFRPRAAENVRAHDAEKLADNLAFCTRPCCRSPRRTWKGADCLSFQEIRAVSRAAASRE